MNMTAIRRLVLSAGLALGMLGAANAEPKRPKWLVLDPFAYQAVESIVDFKDIDSLLLTKFAQTKYKVLDRNAYETAAREQGFGANVELVPAGYSMRGEVVQLKTTGRSRPIAGVQTQEYLATVSIRVNDLRTQQAYEAETLRVTAYCQTPKDMLVHIVQRTVLAILMRDYPPYVMDYDEDENELTISYGKDFINVGEQFEVRRRKEIVDEDNGDVVYKEKTVGIVEITDTGAKTSTAKLFPNGKAKVKDVLRFYENAESEPPVSSQPQVVNPPQVESPSPSPAPSFYPVKKPRIAVAPFISKRLAANVRGLQIGTRHWMDDAASHLVTALTQCESFKVLDRSFGPEIDRELARITNDPNADPNDVCRLSRKLATDYLVVAEVVFSDVVSPGVDYATGRPLPPASAIFAEVRFRCVYAPTTEIKWAQTFSLDSMYFGGTAEQFSSTSAASAAQSISAMIQARIDPAGYRRVQAAQEAARKAAAAAAAAAAPPAPMAPPSAGVNVGF